MPTRYPMPQKSEADSARYLRFAHRHAQADGYRILPDTCPTCGRESHWIETQTESLESGGYITLVAMECRHLFEIECVPTGPLPTDKPLFSIYEIISRQRGGRDNRRKLVG